MLTTGVWAENVAKIGATEYATLQAAFDAATTGQTVQLIADVQLANWLNVNSGKDVTLDLNSHTISPTDDHVKTNYCIILVHRGAKLTVDDLSVGKTGCIDGGTGANAYYGGILLTKNDDPGTEAATLVVNNGTIRGDQAAITGNGNRNNTNVTINGGTFTASSTVAGSEGCAIYHPQNGTLTITGGTFTGYASAVEMRSGTLNITGGTFTATASEYSCKANGNGTTTIGAALAIAQHTTQQNIAVAISGGSFSGQKAVSEANPQGNTSPQISLAITDGTFTGDITADDVNEFVSGGTFSTEVPAGLCVSGFEVVRDAEGHYVAKEESAVEAKIGDVKYASLNAAISVAVSGQTITLLADAEATKELPANVTIDAAEKALTLPTFNVADGAALSYASVINAPGNTYTVATATYNRTGATGTQWGTVCLPFSITEAPDGYTLYTPSAVSATSLTVTEVSYPVAIGTPVIFHKDDTGEAVIISSNASVKIGATPAAQSGDIHLTGTFTGQKITENLSSIYFINGDQFHQAQQSLTVPAYRAYIEYTGSGSGSGSKPVVLSLLVGEQEATATMDAEADMASVESICNVNGNRLTAPQKGINIMKLANGKTMKLIIK